MVKLFHGSLGVSKSRGFELFANHSFIAAEDPAAAWEAGAACELRCASTTHKDRAQTTTLTATLMEVPFYSCCLATQRRDAFFGRDRARMVRRQQFHDLLVELQRLLGAIERVGVLAVVARLEAGLVSLLSHAPEVVVDFRIGIRGGGA